MIVPMKRMTLIALREDEEKVIYALQRLGACEIIPPDDEGEGLNADLFARYDAELRELETAADILKPYAKKPGLLSPLPEIEENVLNDRESRNNARAFALEISALSAEIKDIRGEISRLNQQRTRLVPLLDFGIPIEDFTKGTRHTLIRCGYVSRNNFGALTETGVALESTPLGKDTFLCIAYIHRSEAEEAQKKLTEAGFMPYELPALTGTARENCSRLDDEIARLNVEAQKKQEELENAAQRRDELLLTSDAVNVEYDRLRAMAELLESKTAFIMSAWICAKDAEEVENIIKTETDESYYLEFCDPAEGEDVPSVVTSPEPFTSFETITNMYSRPAYGTLDASPLITPFYMLFFGMMLGDVGYGLLLFVGTILFNKFKKPTGGTKKAVKMFMWSGLSTIVCGFLFGTFFGMDIDTLFGTTDVFPLIMDPMKNVMEMLILCCGLGLVHMIFGLCIKIYMCMREGDTAGAIFDNLSWIFLLVGGIGAAVVPQPFSTAFLITAILGLGLILVFGGRNKKGVMRIFGGLGSLYNITSWLSDTVSYARVFAIGLVGGAMGSVFNLIGGMIAGAGSGFAHVITIILSAVVLIIMHLFSLFINTLSAFAHTARLQYVEFFGKFYDGGGREFRPLGINTKNVRVAREDASAQKK